MHFTNMYRWFISSLSLYMCVRVQTQSSESSVGNNGQEGVWTRPNSLWPAGWGSWAGLTSALTTDCYTLTRWAGTALMTISNAHNANLPSYVKYVYTLLLKSSCSKVTAKTFIKLHRISNKCCSFTLSFPRRILEESWRKIFMVSTNMFRFFTLIMIITNRDAPKCKLRRHYTNKAQINYNTLVKNFFFL